MKWVIIKGVRYSSSVISAFAAYNMDNPFLKVRIRNKYHIVSFDDVNKMASQMVYLMNNYPDFVEIGRWWISKKTVMSWVPKGKAVDGSGWVISFTLSFGLEGGTQIRFDKEDEYLSEIDEIVRRDVESCQIDWFKIDKEIFMLPENKNKTFILGTRKTGCDLLILGGTNCDESYLDGVFGCLGNEKFYVCQPISLYKTTRNIHERPALYAFKIATEYFRAHGMVPVFENSHCKLMRL